MVVVVGGRGWVTLPSSHSHSPPPSLPLASFFLLLSLPRPPFPSSIRPRPSPPRPAPAPPLPITPLPSPSSARPRPWPPPDLAPSLSPPPPYPSRPLHRFLVKMASPVAIAAQAGKLLREQALRPRLLAVRSQVSVAGTTRATRCGSPARRPLRPVRPLATSCSPRRRWSLV